MTPWSTGRQDGNDARHIRTGQANKTGFKKENGYDYICADVDDFKMVSRDVEMWLKYISGTFLVKEHGPRKYYLGNGYAFHETQKL